MGRLVKFCERKRSNSKKSNSENWGGDCGDIKELSTVEQKVIAILGNTVIEGIPEAIDTAVDTVSLPSNVLEVDMAPNAASDTVSKIPNRPRSPSKTSMAETSVDFYCNEEDAEINDVESTDNISTNESVSDISEYPPQTLTKTVVKPSATHTMTRKRKMPMYENEVEQLNIVEIENQRLQVEKERLKIDKERLEVEKQMVKVLTQQLEVMSPTTAASEPLSQDYDNLRQQYRQSGQTLPETTTALLSDTPRLSTLAPYSMDSQATYDRSSEQYYHTM